MSSPDAARGRLPHRPFPEADAVGSAPLLAAGLFFAFTSKVLPVTFPGAPFAPAAGFAVLEAALMQNL